MASDIDETKEGFDMETKSKFTAQGRTKLVSGSILRPELAGLRLIVVPCSASGKPDTQLHKLLDRKWQTVVRDLKGWFAHHIDFKLGSISTSAVQSDTWICHALCFDKDGKLDEAAVVSCVKKIAALALAEKASVHMSVLVLDAIPSMQDLVAPHLLEKGVHTYFYEEADGSFMPVVAEAKSVEEVKAEPAKPVVAKAKPKSKAKSRITRAAAASKPIAVNAELPESVVATDKSE